MPSCFPCTLTRIKQLTRLCFRAYQIGSRSSLLPTVVASHLTLSLVKHAPAATTTVSPTAAVIAGSVGPLVAATGMPISDTLPNNVHHSADDFNLHYPQAARRRYNTGFEAMSLSSARGVTDVTDAVKQAHTATHILNMRYIFPSTDGYAALKRLADTFAHSDVSVWTSIVEGCFERSGFDPSRV